MNSSTEYNILVITSDISKNQGSNELKISTAKFQGLMLYNYGDECTATTGGWVAGYNGIWNEPRIHVATKNSNYFYLQENADNNTGTSFSYFKTSKNVDFSNYKYVNAIAEVSYSGSLRSSNDSQWGHFLVGTYDVTATNPTYTSYEAYHIASFGGFDDYPRVASGFYQNKLMTYKGEIQSQYLGTNIIYCTVTGHWNYVTISAKVYKIWLTKN